VSLPSIQALNGLGGAEFRQALGPLFEAAEPLAAALERDRPYTSYAALLDHAEALLARLPETEQTEVLNAHPRIGARTLSTISAREQGAPEPRLEARLASLNAAYEQRFGFGFVVFVNGRPRSAIVPVLEQRLNGSREDELANGRREMLAIARNRLSSMEAGVRMQNDAQDPARLAALEELQRAALDTYGEERYAEAGLQQALALAATAVWRVTSESLEPLGPEPFPTHA